MPQQGKNTPPPKGEGRASGWGFTKCTRFLNSRVGGSMPEGGSMPCGASVGIIPEGRSLPYRASGRRLTEDARFLTGRSDGVKDQHT